MFSFLNLIYIAPGAYLRGWLQGLEIALFIDWYEQQMIIIQTIFLIAYR